MTGFGTLTILALARTDEVKTALDDAFGARRGITLEVQLGGLRVADGALAERLDRADILLIDVDTADESELALLKRIVDERRDRMAILATVRDVTATTARQLVRQGLDDLVPQPLSRDDLLEALEIAAGKLRQRRHGGRPPGKVLGFMRAKGGVGATTLALHTALSLQNEKKRHHGPSPAVGLLDLDLQFGDAALCLDLQVEGDSVDLLRGPQRPDGARLREAMAQHKSGLSVLPAPLHPMPLEALRPETATHLVALAREEFDYVVVDLPLVLAGWIEPVLACLDHLFIVTQLNVPAIRRTRRLLDLLQDEGLLDLPASIVLNRHGWRLTERERLKQSVKALGRPIDHFIPNQEALVMDAVNRGLSIYDVRSRSRVGRAITAMRDRCLELLAQRAAAAAA
jgi:pilus assembly protein CpaE